MKDLHRILTILILSVLASSVHAQAPEVYGNSFLQRPLPQSVMQYRSHGRIWIEKDMNHEGYQLYIHTSGDIVPEAIQVSILGRTILIENKQSYQREENNNRGTYSYSRSSSSFRRRFSIPRNADTENMRRSEENGVITITLPFYISYPAP